MSNDIELKYRAGDIVWIKWFKGEWWPAEVQAEEKEDTDSDNDDDFHIIVKFLAEDEYFSVKKIENIYTYNFSRKMDLIKKFIENEQCRSVKTKSVAKLELFKKSIILAEKKTKGNENILETITLNDKTPTKRMLQQYAEEDSFKIIKHNRKHKEERREEIKLTCNSSLPALPVKLKHMLEKTRPPLKIQHIVGSRPQTFENVGRIFLESFECEDVKRKRIKKDELDDDDDDGNEIRRKRKKIDKKPKKLVTSTKVRVPKSKVVNLTESILEDWKDDDDNDDDSMDRTDDESKMEINISTSRTESSKINETAESIEEMEILSINSEKNNEEVISEIIIDENSCNENEIIENGGIEEAQDENIAITEIEIEEQNGLMEISDEKRKQTEKKDAQHSENIEYFLEEASVVVNDIKSLLRHGVEEIVDFDDNVVTSSKD